MKPESKIRNEIKQALQERGLCVMVNHGSIFSHRGLSDLTVVLPGGHVAFLEVKTTKGKLSSSQEVFLNLMKSYGCRAGVARSVEEALSLVDKSS